MSPGAEEILVIGVDGGGTSTRAALVNGAGTILGTGTAGASNIQAMGREATERNISSAVEAAWSSAQRSPQQVAAIALGMAGVVSEIDRATITRIAEKLLPGAAIAVDHDLRSALHGGLVGNPGVVLIVGTGSSCYGRNAAGATWRSGGWGYLVDDVGSGYWLGLHGLAAVARAIDGRGGATILHDRLFMIRSLANANDLSHLIHSVLTRSDVAALAPLVLECAFTGDQVAREIVWRGADELALMAATVVEHLGLRNMPTDIVASGGLIENDPRYRALIAERIALRVPQATLIPPILPAVLGSALIALEIAGIAPEAPLIARLRDHAAGTGVQPMAAHP